MLKSSPSETLVAQDSLPCLETASGAGFFTVGVYDQVSAADREEAEKISDAYIMKLDELKKIILSKD